MRKGEKKVLWVFLYVLIFLAVFALSAVFKITYNPLNEKYSVDWNDSVGTMLTDLTYGEKEANTFEEQFRLYDSYNATFLSITIMLSEGSGP